MTHTASTPFFALLGQIAARVWRVFNNRRQYAELKYWTDEQLKDIGLTRGDVRRALALPFYVDPSTVLNDAPALRQTLNIGAANAPLTSPSIKLVKTDQEKRGPLAA